MKKGYLFLIFAFVTSVATSQKLWDGGAGTSNWSDANNWFPNGVPSSTDDVYLDNQYTAGSYTVNMPNSVVTVKSLKIYPSSTSSSITVEIPTITPAASAVGKLILTGTGSNSLCIGNRGRLNNRHGGSVLVRSIQINDSTNYGMLLDVGGYYMHNTLTRDLPLLYKLDARQNSTFEIKKNITGTDNNFMIFPVTAGTYPGHTQIKFYNFILSGSTSPTFSPSYNVTPARPWDMYIEGDLTVRDNASFGFHRGGSGQDNRSIYIKGNVSITNTTTTSWISSIASVSFGWRVFFNGTQQQTITGNIDIQDRLEINNPNGVVVNNTLNISSNMFSFYTSTLPSIVFTQGKITTASGTGLVSINVTASASIVNHDASKYIVGKLKRSVAVNTAYDFPIGTASNYELATLTFGANLGGVSNITAEFFTSPVTPFNSITESSNTYIGVVDAGFWRMIANANINASGTYTLRLNGRGFSSPAQQPCASTLGRRTSTSNAWSLSGTAQTVSPLTPGVASGQRQYASSASSLGTGNTDFAILYTSSTGQTYYQDADGDGWYTATVSSCSAVGAGWSTTLPSGGNGDCAPNDNTKWQSGTLYIDADNDGYDGGTATVCYGNTVPTGYRLTSLGSDCNDGNASIHPSASETCGNGIDEDCNGSDLACGPNTWKGTNTNWSDPLNWTNGVPTSTTDGLIPTTPVNGNNFPVLNSNSNVKNLSLQTGAYLTVNTGVTLNIYGDLALSGNDILGDGTIAFSASGAQAISGSGGNFKQTYTTVNLGSSTTLSGNMLNLYKIIKVNGTLITGNKITFISDANGTALIDGNGSGNISGTVTFQRNVTGGNGYRYFSSPVNGAFVSSVADDFPVVGANNNPSQTFTNPWPTLWTYDETNTSNNMNFGWKSYTDPSNLLDRMTGYAGIMSATTLDFTGTVLNGIQTKSISNTSSGNSISDGWNLIGNPYPGPIDWHAIKALNASISPTIYYWANSGTYSGQYATYNSSIGTGINGGTRNIASSQGFFVKATSSGTLTMNNGVRTTEVNPAFLKQEAGEFPLIRLQVTDGGGKSDETIIYFKEECSSSYSDEFDSYKWFTEDAEYPSLYSFKTGQTPISIQGLPTLGNQAIPIGFKSTSKEIYTLSTTEFINFPSEIQLVLEDRKLNIFTPLTKNTYEFIAQPEEDQKGRFQLWLKSEPLPQNDQKVLVNLFPKNEKWYIQIKGNSSANFEYRILNLNGQLITWSPNTPIDSNPKEINIQNLPSGLFFISVLVDGIQENFKLIQP
jgi:hypothetical protein